MPKSHTEKEKTERETICSDVPGPPADGDDGLRRGVAVLDRERPGLGGGQLRQRGDPGPARCHRHRGMAAQLFYETAGSPEVTGEPAFSDVTGDYADAVTWAAGAGYVQGVGGDLYEPDRPLTRQAFAAML